MIKMSRPYFKLLIIYLVMAITSTPVSAADKTLLDLSLAELMNIKITTLSRKAEPLDDAPGTVHVITSEIIRQRGYTSLKDALQILPGFNVFLKDLGYAGNIRGLAANDNEKFSLLINGIELNQVNEPEFLNGPINLDNVERIEVIVGPSSIFNPANTLVATVNIITFNSNENKLVVATGDEKKYSLSAHGGNKWEDDGQFSYSATIEERKGFDAWDNSFSTAPMKDTAGQNISGGGYGMDHFLVLQAKQAGFYSQFVSYNTEYPEIRLIGGGEENSTYTDAMDALTLSYRMNTSENLTTKFSTTVAYKRVFRSAGDRFPVNSKKQHDYNTELGFVYTGITDHYFQTGIQYIYEDHFDNFIHRSEGDKTYFFQDKSTNGLGIYLDDNIKVNEKLQLTAGIRFDKNSIVSKNVHVAGRVAAVYKVNDNWTSKVFYNRAVRLPSPIAALREIGPFGSPVAERAEVLQTLEFGNVFYLDDLRLTANLYYQNLDDFITWGSPHTNIGDYAGWGGEFTLNYSFSNDNNFWMNISTINSEFTNNETFDTVTNAGDAHRVTNDHNEMIGSPKLTISTGFDLYLSNNSTLSTQLRYFTNQPAEVTNNGGETFTFETVTDQFYVDLTMTFDDLLGSGFDLRISGKNLFDNRDEIAGPTLSGQYSPRGRSFEIAAYFRFK